MAGGSVQQPPGQRNLLALDADGHSKVEPVGFPGDSGSADADLQRAAGLPVVGRLADDFDGDPVRVDQQRLQFGREPHGVDAAEDDQVPLFVGAACRTLQGRIDIEANWRSASRSRTPM